MKFTEHLYTALQAGAIGAILMAYIADYNRGQLPLAIMCLSLSILCRIASK